MSVSVRIPALLRSYTGGAAQVSAEAGTLREVIAGLDAACPGLGGRGHGPVRRARSPGLPVFAGL